jgi:hypothetical protein
MLNTRGRRLMAGWLLTDLFIFGLMLRWSDQDVVWGIAGALFLAWGLAVATNFRGIADDFPRRWVVGPWRNDRSRATVRRGFAFFAVWGLVVLTGMIVRALG